MAYGKSSGNRPHYSISMSVAVQRGRYEKGPSFGLWVTDNGPGSGPMARGSIKGSYLKELISALRQAAADGNSVSFSLFKNSDQKKRRYEDDEDEDRNEDRRKERDRERDEDDDDRPRKKKPREEEEEEEKEERREKRPAKGGEKGGGKSGKKSGKDWDFDDED